MNSRISKVPRSSRTALMLLGIVLCVGGASLSAGLVEWLDPAFGNEGRAEVGVEAPAGLAQQADGKLVVGGHVNDTITVARFTVAGQPDPTFGIGGTATFALPGVSEVADVAVQPDGKIVVVSNVNRDVVVVRLLDDGSPDMEFGTAGVATGDVFGRWDFASAMLIDHANRIVVTGVSSPTAYDDEGQSFVMRFRPDGLPDTTFADGGSVIVSFAEGMFSWATGIAIASNGELVIAGTRREQEIVVIPGLPGEPDFETEVTVSNIFVARLNTDGAVLDWTISDLGSHVSEEAGGVAVTDTGIVVGAWTAAGDEVRNAVVLMIAGGTTRRIDLGMGFAPEIAVHADGTIVAGGSNFDMYVVRLRADGSIDETFGTSGRVEFSAGWGECLPRADVVVQPDKKVVVSKGLCESGLTRILAEPRVLTPPSMSIGDVTIAEGNEGQSVAYLTVTLSETAREFSSFRYSTADGTAFAGSDYDAADYTIEIPAGEREVTIAVGIRGDTIGEADEAFSVVLSDVQGAVVGDGEATVTLVDDDDRFAVDVTVIDFAADPNPARLGDVITLRATVGNLGPFPAHQATLQVSWSGTPFPGTFTCDVDGTPIVGGCQFAELLAGQTRQIALTLPAANQIGAFPFQAVATAGAADRDVVATNNTRPLSLVIDLAPIDLIVTAFTADPNPAHRGQEITLRATIGNFGPTVAHEATLQISFFGNPLTGIYDCGPAGTPIAAGCRFAALSSGQSREIAITLPRATEIATVTLQAVAAAGPTERDTAMNNNALAVTVIVKNPGKKRGKKIAR